MSHRIAIQLCRENAVGASVVSRWELDLEGLRMFTGAVR